MKVWLLAGVVWLLVVGSTEGGTTPDGVRRQMWHAANDLALGVPVTTVPFMHVSGYYSPCPRPRVGAYRCVLKARYRMYGDPLWRECRLRVLAHRHSYRFKTAQSRCPPEWFTYLNSGSASAKPGG